MRCRFQADADLNPQIEKRLRLREPAIDIQGAKGVLLDGTSDSQVLQIAAEAGRVLISRDVNTMPIHFVRFIATQTSPGIIMIPSSRPIGSIIEALLLIWLMWTPEDLENQIRWLP